MANQDDPEQEQQNDPNEDPEDQQETQKDSDSESDSDSSTYSDEYVTDDEDEPITYTRPGDEPPAADNTPETNIRRFTRVLDSKRVKKIEEEEDQEYVFYDDLFDFPEDREKWTERDLRELWADAPLEMTKPGWDPVWADEEDWEVMNEEIKAGRDPPIAPFYLPYRKPYPAIPDNHYDISNPKAVVEELDRIEEFLTWVSYIFADGSSYEGTVWDDLAHGKGVYIAENGLVRYEGEWFQNNMEGHGVVEVDIPDIEPIPGSKLEAKMRAEGKIISRDFMSPEDRKWLEMDIEDSIHLADGQYEIPFWENDEWIRQFGRKPEKGRYRYAGQWKHGRMHGCGVYDVNERTIFGRFYFGELLQDSEGCDEETSALHSGLAEVAAAKARMFLNKPDGMVREERGPYSDPQHPYFYEEEDVWMAPGFINKFHEVPDYWKTYVHEIDQEREMWLNSFYKSPFRIPMPAELEYWWEKDEPPEFVVVNQEPEPDPEDPSKVIYTEDPLILHTPTGRLINYVEDEEYGVRLFWQPPLKEGEDVDPEKIEFLPLGYDEFYGKEAVEEKQTTQQRIVKAIQNVVKPVCDKIEKWAEDKKKASEMKMEIIKKELDLVEAEICLEEAIEEMDEELRMREKEEEKKMEMGLEEEEEESAKEETPALEIQPEKAEVEIKVNDNENEDQMEVEEEEEEEDDDAPSSFGSVSEQNGKKPGESPFSSLSLSFTSCGIVSSTLQVPSRLQHSFLSWKKGKVPVKSSPVVEDPNCYLETVASVHFPSAKHGDQGRLRAITQAHKKSQPRILPNRRVSKLRSLSCILSGISPSISPKCATNVSKANNRNWLHEAPKCDFDAIFSLQTPLGVSESCMDTIVVEPHYLSL